MGCSSDTLSGTLSLQVTWPSEPRSYYMQSRRDRTIGGLRGVWNTGPLQPAQVKRGNYWKHAGLSPRTQAMSPVPSRAPWELEVFLCLCGATLSLLLSPIWVSAPGSGFPIHDSWPLCATETDRGLLVPGFLLLGAADLMGHQATVWLGRQDPMAQPPLG